MNEQVRLSRLLKVVSNLFETKLNNKSAFLDLTCAQTSVLGYLVTHKDDEINPIDIEKNFSLKRPTVTGILKRMEEKNFILIVQDENDKRYKKIKLTEKSLEIHELMINNLNECEKVLFKNLSKEDKDNLYRILSIMFNNLSGE